MTAVPIGPILACGFRRAGMRRMIVVQKAGLQPSVVGAGRKSGERRKAERHRCLTECLARIEGAPLGADWPGMAYNISTGGIAVALPFPVPVGTVLLIERRSLRCHAPVLRVRVLRCQLERCVWLHGCAFVERLLDEDLRDWLPVSLEDLVG